MTILKLDRPERGTEADGDNNTGAGDGAETDRGNRPVGAVVMPGAGGGSRSGGGFMMGGPGGPGGASETDRAAMLKQLEAMSSGSETVTIPVGIRMLKPDTANAKDATTGGREINMNMIEASLSDIQAEKMLSVWLDESVTDRKVASFVLVMR